MSRPMVCLYAQYRSPAIVALWTLAPIQQFEWVGLFMLTLPFTKSEIGGEEIYAAMHWIDRSR